MPACPRCGADNSATSRFCSSCGTALAERAEAARAERKVVTVVFVDIVGFTSRAERLDPEDVGRLLTPFHARARGELERFGGTVEKFIGDAVLAVFGAPAAHEDDPERAVRAAFATREAIGRLNERDPSLDLHVRIGISTGEAFVRLDADPGRGEPAVAGDVVNTAARLQQAAPVDAVIVGDATRRATADVVEYRPLDPVAAKGKREPVPVWEALALAARPAFTMRRRVPLVGRVSELGVLVEAAATARAGRSVQTVSLVGEAGIGKSRLAWELHDALHAGGEPFVWRHGRSLPYGAGVTFWALAEVVKAHAGVLETDTADAARERVRASVEASAGETSDARWIERHLGPLVGIGGEAGEQRESFAAWRRYLDGIARACGLLVVGLEDLQWADDGMLDFVEHLAAWGRETPILVVCTARPELLDRRPGWPGVVRLDPLDSGETVSLLGSLLAGTEVRAEMWPQLLTQSGGNPLYAEEYARMLRERPQAPELPLPGSVQAIITARIDALPPAAKALLQDAAVVGKGFWPGLLEQVSGLPGEEVSRRLAELDQKSLVHPVTTSAVAGEPQFAFSHVLIRDIAYGQIPRAERIGRHRRVAEWIESLAPDRAASTAEMTAHHFRSALEYARLAHEPTEDLADPARRSLRAAGQHAVALGAHAAAARFFADALALWPEEDAKLGRLRLALGTARFRADGEGADDLEQARSELVAVGDWETAAEADVLLAELRFRHGDVSGAFERLERSLAGLADAPPSRQKAYVLSTLSRFRAAEYECSEAIRIGNEALAMASELGLDEIRAHALNNIGTSRVTLGDPGGVADLEQSVEIAAALGSVESVRGYLNLGTTLANLGQLERAFAVHAEGRRAAERFGEATGIRWFEIERLFECYWRGQWDDAAESADGLLGAAAGATDYYTELGARMVRGWVRLGRGDVDGARADAARHLELARDVQYPQALFPALAQAARVLAAGGSSREAELCAEELLRAWRASTIQTASYWTADLAFALTELGRGAELVEIARGVEAPTPWLEAAVAFARGDAAQAADRYAAIGSLPDEAYARLRTDGTADAEAFVRRAGAEGYRVTPASRP